jgi:hypothetical protein
LINPHNQFFNSPNFFLIFNNDFLTFFDALSAIGLPSSQALLSGSSEQAFFHSA